MNDADGSRKKPPVITQPAALFWITRRGRLIGRRDIRCPLQFIYSLLLPPLGVELAKLLKLPGRSADGPRQHRCNNPQKKDDQRINKQRLLRCFVVPEPKFNGLVLILDDKGNHVNQNRGKDDYLGPELGAQPEEIHTGEVYPLSVAARKHYCDSKALCAVEHFVAAPREPQATRAISICLRSAGDMRRFAAAFLIRRVRPTVC